MDLGKMVDKAKEWAGKNPDKTDSYVEKGEDFANSRFAGHEGQVDQAGQKAKDYLHGGQEQPPAGQEAPVVLDIATSVASLKGRVRGGCEPDASARAEAPRDGASTRRRRRS